METATALAEEYGAGMDRSMSSIAAGYVALMQGEPEVAERRYREVVSFQREIGDLGHLSSSAPAQAEALAALGRDDEALSLTEEAERASIEGDADAQVNWRRVRAQILARRGRLDEATRLASKAADLARATDDLESEARP